jgi:hypothetical protein
LFSYWSIRPVVPIWLRELASSDALVNGSVRTTEDRHQIRHAQPPRLIERNDGSFRFDRPALRFTVLQFDCNAGGDFAHFGRTYHFPMLQMKKARNAVMADILASLHCGLGCMSVTVCHCMYTLAPCITAVKRCLQCLFEWHDVGIVGHKHIGPNLHHFDPLRPILCVII